MYPTEGDIRTLFMFLVERLPKESAEAADEPMGMVYCSIMPFIMWQAFVLTNRVICYKIFNALQNKTEQNLNSVKH